RARASGVGMHHMSDPDDTDTDLSSRITAALSLCDLVTLLADLATNEKTYKARLRRLEKLEKQVAGAERNLAAATTQAAAIVAKAESDVKAIRADAQRRLEAAAVAEGELVEREQKIARLENAWRGLREPADVLSGLRSPEFSPLQKARMAH